MADKLSAAQDALLGRIAEVAEKATRPDHIEALARAYRAVLGGPQPGSVTVTSK